MRNASTLYTRVQRSVFKSASLVKIRAIVGAIVISLCGLFRPAPIHAQDLIDQAAKQLDSIERLQSETDRFRHLETIEKTFRAPRDIPTEKHELEDSIDSSSCLNVNRIVVTGVTLFSQKQIRDRVAEWEEQCLSLNDMNKVLKALTLAFMDEGFIASRAYIPEQDLSGGLLTVAIVEGQLEGIKSEDGTVGHGQIATAFPRLVGAPVNLRDIEQGLDQINRLRSQSAHISLLAGKNHGGSVLGLSVQKTKPWWMSLSSDNLGTDASGRFQSRIDFGVDNILSLNDEWSFGYQRSMAGSPLNFSPQRPNSNGFHGAFSIPFGYWLFGIQGSSSSYRSLLKTPQIAIETSGKSHTLSMDSSRVIHRDQVSKTWITARLTRKQTENFILGNRIDTTSRVLTIGTVEFGHSRRVQHGEGTALIAFHRGLNLFGDFDDFQSDAFSPKGQFSKVTASLAYGQPFDVQGLSMRFQSTLFGQGSPDMLFASEQLSLGGSASVRGAREPILAANNGVFFRNELSVVLPKTLYPRTASFWGRIEPYVALDFGSTLGHSDQGGSIIGSAVGIRTRGRPLNFDISYAKTIALATPSKPPPTSSGVFQMKLSVAF